MDSEMSSDQEDGVATQTLGGKIVKPVAGDPVYMLGSFRGSELHLSHLDAVVQVRPQLHHLDANDELERHKLTSSATMTNGTTGGKAGKEDLPGQIAERAEAARIESKAVDIKFKGPDDDTNSTMKTNERLLHAIQTESWQKYNWVDESEDQSYVKFDTQMHLQFPKNANAEGDPDTVPHLEAVLGNQDWLDRMSAPRQAGPGKKSLMGKVKGRERERMRRRRNDEAKKQRNKETVERGGPVEEGDKTADESTDESELSEIDATPPPEDAEMADPVSKEEEVIETISPRKPKGRPRKSQPAETIDIDD